MYNNPFSSNTFDVAVIGAGASGALVAAQFEKLAPAGSRLVLIGNQLRPARGVAYDTRYQANLLNVPAGNMSAFPDDMEHFTRWLAKHLPGSSAATFAPRKLYGDYLLNIFMKLRKYSDKVDYLNTKAIGLTRQDDLWSVRLENGNTVRARSVVLALGNLLLPSDPIDFSSVKTQYQRNPWSPEITRDLPVDAPVLLIGTGLTMVDVALSLREAGHRGPIHAISRHGRLYRSHKPYQPRPLKEIPDAFNTPLGTLRWIRSEIEVAERTGNNWRAVIDSLRPHTSSIWKQWDLQQRKSFLRHARNLWDIHRHRMAAEIADQLNILIEEHILTIHCGSLVLAKPNGDTATIQWKDHETNELGTLHAAQVINCTGPSRDITRSKSQLVTSLLASGWITPDPLQLGLVTDDDGRLFDMNGSPSPGLFTLGPLQIAGLWESIAIPEIRAQALVLTEVLISEIVGTGIPT